MKFHHRRPFADASDFFNTIGQDPPFRTSLPPITARIFGEPFEIRGLELRVIGAINKTEKIDQEAQNHFIQTHDLSDNAQFNLEELSVTY